MFLSCTKGIPILPIFTQCSYASIVWNTLTAEFGFHLFNCPTFILWSKLKSIYFASIFNLMLANV